MIGRLPLVPISQLVPLSGGRSGRSVYACVERLAERGLVSVIPGPGHLGKPHRRLLLISNLGLAALAWRREVDPASLARAWRLGRAPLRVLVGQLPALLSLYALLGLLAGDRAWSGATQAVVAARAMASTLGWSWTSPECDAARVRGAPLGGSRRCMC